VVLSNCRAPLCLRCGQFKLGLESLPVLYYQFKAFWLWRFNKDCRYSHYAKVLGIHAHPIKCMGLRLCKLATPPTMPLTAWHEMSLAEKEAILVLLYLRYSFAAIGLITGWPQSTVHTFVTWATDSQSLENTPFCGRLHQQKVENVFWAFWAFWAFWRFLKVKFTFSRFCWVQLFESYSAILHPQYDGIFKLGIVFQNRYSLVGYIS